jgi:hypothetical protein
LHTKIDAKCGNDPGVGTAAKPFTLKTPDGREISLASSPRQGRAAQLLGHLV